MLKVLSSSRENVWNWTWRKLRENESSCSSLHLAKDVADKTSILFAGSICNTNIYKPNKVRAKFDEQVCWAKEKGAEFIIAKTYHLLEEAEIALEVLKSYNLPAIINIGALLPVVDGTEFNLLDSIPIWEACKTLLNKIRSIFSWCKLYTWSWTNGWSYRTHC